MITIYFWYGLAFVVMGFTIFTLPERKDFLKLSDDLWLVGLFGLAHGVNEWIDLFIFRGRPFNVDVLKIAGGLLLPISFVFLIIFAARAISKEKPGLNWIRYLWIFCLSAWLISFYSGGGFLISGIAARYFICLPGTFLTVVALFLRYLKVDKAQIPKLVSIGAVASICLFAIYGVLSGLVVPKADFLLASEINYTNFFNSFGVPVQLYKMFCAIGLSISFFGMAGMFYYEKYEGKYVSSMSIGQKIISGFLLISLLILGVSYGAFSKSRQIIENAIGEQSILYANEIMFSIDEELRGRIEQVEVYGHQLALRPDLTFSNEAFDSMEDRESYIARQDRDWIATPEGTTTPFMNEIINNSLANRIREEFQLNDFYEELYGFPIFPEVFVTNRYGVVVAATNRTSDYFQADEDWYQKAAKEKRFWVGDIEYDRSADAYSLDIIVPVRDRNGDLLGALKVVYNFADIIGAIERGVEQALSDPDLHEIPDVVSGVNIKLLTKDLEVIFSEGMFRPFEIDPWISANADMIYKSNNAYLVVESQTPGEESMLIAHAHSSGNESFEGLGWILVVEQEIQQVYVAIGDLKALMLSFSMGAVLLAVAFGYFISRGITSSIIKLGEAVRKTGEGEVGVEIEVESKDEIGDLTAGFNRMTMVLQETTVSKKYMDEIITSMLDCLVVLSSDATIRMVNRATCVLLGYKEKELLGKDINFLLPEGESVSKGAGLKKLIKEGKLASRETEFRARNGKIVPMLISGSAIKNSGKIEEGEDRKKGQGIVIVAKDITERKKVEAYMIKNEERYRVLFHLSRDAIMLLTPPSWQFTSANSATIELFGAKDEREFISKGPWNVSPERQPDGELSFEKAKRMIEKAMTDGTNFFEWDHMKLNGEVFPATVLLSRIKMEGKQQLQATVRDITEYKKSEKALVAEKTFSKDIVDTISDIFYVFNAKGEFVRWNLAFEKVSKYSHEEISAMKPTDFFNKEGAENISVAIGNAFETGFATAEEEFVSKDGERTPMLFSGATMKSPSGELLLCGIGKDITAQKKTERELIQSEKLASIGKLSSGLAHNLNSPLMGLQNIIEVHLDKAPAGSREHKEFSEMLEGIKHMTVIVKDIGEFTRKSQREYVELSFNEVIDSILSFVEPQFGEKGIRCTLKYAKDLLAVVGDRNQLQQVVLNLIANAISATPQGGDVIIETKNSSDRAAIIVEFMNTGEGIKKEVLAKIFDPFFTTKKVGKGTGLGLSVSQSIVREHKGRIDVESAMGKGAKFTITLPVA